jgi:hypothetical protein
MFNGNGGSKNGKKDYSQVSLDDFSDDDDSDFGEGDFVKQSIRNQQVSSVVSGMAWKVVAQYYGALRFP